MQSSRAGNALAAFSFILWGILPLYYQYLPQADINELLALRIIFSVPFMLIAMLLLGKKLPSLSELLADKKSLIMCCIAGIVMCVSWYAFTWAMTHGQVLAASLGYFINPLFAISLGVDFFKRKVEPSTISRSSIGSRRDQFSSLVIRHFTLAGTCHGFFLCYLWLNKKNTLNTMPSHR